MSLHSWKSGPELIPGQMQETGAGTDSGTGAGKVQQLRNFTGRISIEVQSVTT